jgi:hypothetical protein
MHTLLGLVLGHRSSHEGAWINMIKFYRNTRWNYWSCTKLANLIRGTNKPLAVTLEEWDIWKDNAETSHSFRYWVAEKLLDKIQNLWLFPADLWHSVDVYFSNRFRTQTHILPTNLSVGQWHEFDQRLLHGMFTAFTNFIEDEQAGVSGRSPEAGVKHLIWASHLKYGDGDWVGEDHELYDKPTHQAVAAKWQMAAYEWWKYQRPNRPDLWKDDKLTYDERDEIEKQRRAEDEKWMIELIQHRHELWT